MVGSKINFLFCFSLPFTVEDSFIKSLYDRNGHITKTQRAITATKIAPRMYLSLRFVLEVTSFFEEV